MRTWLAAALTLSLSAFGCGEGEKQCENDVCDNFKLGDSVFRPDPRDAGSDDDADAQREDAPSQDAALDTDADGATDAAADASSDADSSTPPPPPKLGSLTATSTGEFWKSNPYCLQFRGKRVHPDGPITFMQGGYKQALIPSAVSVRVAWPAGTPLTRNDLFSSPQLSMDFDERSTGERGTNRRWWHHRYAGVYDVIDVSGITGFERKTIGLIHGETHNTRVNGSCSLRHFMAPDAFTQNQYCAPTSDPDYFKKIWPSYTGILSYGISTSDATEWGMAFDNATNTPAIPYPWPLAVKENNAWRRTSHGHRHPDGVKVWVKGVPYLYVYYLDDVRNHGGHKKAYVTVARAKLVGGNTNLRFEKYTANGFKPQRHAPTKNMSQFLRQDIAPAALSVSTLPQAKWSIATFQVTYLWQPKLYLGVGTYFDYSTKTLEIRYALSRDGVIWSTPARLPRQHLFANDRVFPLWNPLTLSNSSFNKSNSLPNEFYISSRKKQTGACADKNMYSIKFKYNAP